MKQILVGTNRRKSRSKQIALIIQKIYQDLGEETEIMDLADLPLHELTGEQYGQTLGTDVGIAIEKINRASGVVFIVPEYNGSFPGALKYFIDHWKYPESFEQRPVCLIGLGGLFGGLRPVEHLQQVLGYRNSFVFPQRVFLQNIFTNLKDGEIKDPLLQNLLVKQAQDFQKFVLALEAVGLDANSMSKLRPPPKGP
ncbi:MAG: NADPH-dependent FMN reductase [Bdellovibrio sp.]